MPGVAVLFQSAIEECVHLGPQFGDERGRQRVQLVVDAQEYGGQVVAVKRLNTGQGMVRDRGQRPQICAMIDVVADYRLLRAHVVRGPVQREQGKSPTDGWRAADQLAECRAVRKFEPGWLAEVLNAQCRAPQLDCAAVFDVAVAYFDSVHRGAVAAVEIADPHAMLIADEFAMEPRDRAVRQGKITRAMGADRRALTDRVPMLHRYRAPRRHRVCTPDG